MSQCNEEGAQELNQVITISYASIQLIIALFISVIGAVHVKRCKNEEKKKVEINTTITLNAGCLSMLSDATHTHIRDHSSIT